MIIYLCDACRVKLAVDDVNLSIEAARSAPAGSFPNEHFCAEHLERAEEYWVAKAAYVSKALAKADQGWTQSKKEFFRDGQRST